MKTIKMLLIILLTIQTFQLFAEIKLKVTGAVDNGPLYTYSYTIKNTGTDAVHTFGLTVPADDIDNVTSFWNTDKLSYWTGFFDEYTEGRSTYPIIVWYSERGLLPGETAGGFAYTSRIPPGDVNWGASIQILPVLERTVDSYTYGITKGPKDIQPPAVSKIHVIKISASSAEIRWATSEGAKSSVEYGKTVNYGLKADSLSNFMISDMLVLSKLAPDTLYHFRVISKDRDGNVAASSDFTFTTKPSSGLPNITIMYSDSYSGTDRESLHPGEVVAVTIEVKNSGSGEAADIVINSISATGGVTCVTPSLPRSLPNFAAGMSQRVLVYFSIPAKGTQFKATFSGTYKDINDKSYSFNYPYDFFIPGAPVAKAGGPYEGNEGAKMDFDAGGTYVPDVTKVSFDAGSAYNPRSGVLSFRWDFNNDGNWDTKWSKSPKTSHTWNDDWKGEVKLEVSDGKNMTSSIALVLIKNAAPKLSSIKVVQEVSRINKSFSVNAPFSDASTVDTHNGNWDWGDGNVNSGVVAEKNGKGTITGKHSYSKPGLYTIKCKIKDDDGGEDNRFYKYIVIYNPDGGAVTGSGWFDSPAGAYAGNKTISGKANFKFYCRYRKNGTTPAGFCEFNLKAGNSHNPRNSHDGKTAGLHLNSFQYQWLVIDGTTAKCRGTGKINGKGKYGFMITIADEAIDKFRIKIWDFAKGNVIYDNQPGETDDAEAKNKIEGGNIGIYKK